MSYGTWGSNASRLVIVQHGSALQDTSQTSQWHVPANTIIQVGRLLKPGEDEIAQVVTSLQPGSTHLCLF